MDLSFARVPAVDGTKLTSRELESVRRGDPKSAKLTAGEIACFFSHRKAWALIANGQDRYGIVMEDDVCLSKHAAFFLKNDSWIPKGTPVLRLETTHLRMVLGQSARTVTVAGNRFRLRGCKALGNGQNDGGFGCGCYIVHRQFAAWLTSEFTKFSSPVDCEIFRAAHFDPSSANVMKAAPLQLVPAVAVQQQFSTETFLPPGAEISLLEPDRRAVRKEPYSPKKIIAREIMRIFSISHWKRQLHGQRVPLLK